MQLVFRLPTDKQARWGTYYPHKPDFDNLAKAVCDVAEKAGLFAVGDQQIADARIIKLWSSPAEAGVYVQLLELRPLKAEKNPAGGAGFLFGEHQG
jgi:Holliday junction resolvase RusA-like endonuclease